MVIESVTYINTTNNWRTGRRLKLLGRNTNNNGVIIDFQVDKMSDEELSYVSKQFAGELVKRRNNADSNLASIVQAAEDR